MLWAATLLRLAAGTPVSSCLITTTCLQSSQLPGALETLDLTCCNAKLLHNLVRKRKANFLVNRSKALFKPCLSDFDPALCIRPLQSTSNLQCCPAPTRPGDLTCRHHSINTLEPSSGQSAFGSASSFKS